MSRLLIRLGVVLTTAAAVVMVGGSPAMAHVTVHSDDAVQGGSAEMAFRVPNESDTGSTVTVTLALPADTPIAEVDVLPPTGWTYRTTKAAAPASLSTEDGVDVSEVVTQVEWHATSQDTAIKPGEYQVFRIVAGPLPATDWLVFKVVQAYDDGQVQRWIDGPSADGSEPEHPAPMLAVDATSAGHGHSQAAAVVPAASSQTITPAAVWWTVAVALAALIAALAAVVVSIRTARRAGGDEPPG
jgi:uncharacterized protein YcnI